MNLKPKVAIILGSGLGDLVESIEDKEYIDYKDIPNFTLSTVVGHEGRLVFGNIKGVEVLGIDCITNMATGIQKQKHSHARVIETAKKVSVDFCKWVAKIVENIG